MIATVHSVAVIGFDGDLIEVETDAKQGLPGLQIVGTGNKAVAEARERVRSALRQSDLPVPPLKLVVNLAPAELPKQGAGFDLPIALSILVAHGMLRPSDVATTLFAGELGLDGRLKPIRGAVAVAEAALKAGFRCVILPEANSAQAGLISGITVIGASDLRSVYLHLKRIAPLVAAVTPSSPAQPSNSALRDLSIPPATLRVLQIAAAGRHHLLLSGPPGTGKTTLARYLQDLLPPLSDIERRSVTKLHGIADETTEVIQHRPFRSPHHLVTPSALLGGGARLRPGEVSLAHHGVLLLDELPEYSRETLEGLRQPLEDRQVSVTRSSGTVHYPADFLLVATMNPCPCGYLGDPVHECRCTPYQVAAYHKRLSGPLLDRIDLFLTVSRQREVPLFAAPLLNKNQQLKVLAAINGAIERQQRRYKSYNIYNASLSLAGVRQRADITPDARRLLAEADRQLGLSVRGSLKVIRVARTIADLDGNDAVEAPHIAEALQLRRRTFS